MKYLVTLALVCAVAADSAQTATLIQFDCQDDVSKASGAAPNLHGNWDFVFNAAGSLNFGLLSIGFIDGTYGGSLTPVGTAPVVVRKITLTGSSIHMIVSSREGDVFFDGKLSAKGDRMCGIATYHGNRRFPMVAQKRPSTYQSQLPATHRQ